MLAKQRAEGLLSTLQKEGFTGRPAAVEAACAALCASESTRVLVALFVRWHEHSAG